MRDDTMWAEKAEQPNQTSASLTQQCMSNRLDVELG